MSLLKSTLSHLIAYNIDFTPIRYLCHLTPQKLILTNRLLIMIWLIWLIYDYFSLKIAGLIQTLKFSLLNITLLITFCIKFINGYKLIFGICIA